MNLTTIYHNSEKPDVADIPFTHSIYAINLIGGVWFLNVPADFMNIEVLKDGAYSLLIWTLQTLCVSLSRV